MSGAPRIGKERMVPQSFRADAEQLRKFDALGGGAWARAMIDAARKSDAVTAAPRKKNGAGLVAQSFRAEPSQSARFKTLGGSAWLRAKIDAAPWPRGRKVTK